MQEPKLKIIEEGLRLWADKNRLPQRLKEEVIKNIKQVIELDKDADVENLFSLLPWRTRRKLKRSLFMDRMMAVCSSIILKLVSPLSLYTHIYIGRECFLRGKSNQTK